jgi:hypothetical protein
MGFFNLDGVVLALVVGTVFFIMLGILVLVIGEIDRRKLVGILCVLVGVALALFALHGEDLGAIFVAVLAAIIGNELLGYFGIVE